MELHELVDAVAAAEEVSDAASEKLAHLQWELTRMMQQDGATEAVSETHKATLKATSSYDQGKLHAVLEFVPQADLIEAGAYFPEHEETRIMAARFNVTKLKPFVKRGGDIREAIEGSKVTGEPRLKVVAR